MSLLSNDLAWWVSVVDLPALGALLAFIWRTRAEAMNEIAELSHRLETRSQQLRDALSGFKLEVAKNYASHNDLKELETRLVGHLLRIEAKLDRTALKAERIRD